VLGCAAAASLNKPYSRSSWCKHNFGLDRQVFLQPYPSAFQHDIVGQFWSSIMNAIDLLRDDRPYTVNVGYQCTADKVVTLSGLLHRLCNCVRLQWSGKGSDR
jgi:hypothetical protein